MVKFARVSREVVEAHTGTVLELRGDEAPCVFVSPRQAVRAALDPQRRFVDENVPLLNQQRTDVVSSRLRHVIRNPILGALYDQAWVR